MLVGVSKISSGNEDHATPPGRYKIIQKSKDHKSSLYGVFKDRTTGMTTNDNVDIRVDKPQPDEIYYPAPMPNFMRFTGGIGMHTGYLPGYAASHGCIRMPHHMSEKFFENVSVGTPSLSSERRISRIPAGRGNHAGNQPARRRAMAPAARGPAAAAHRLPRGRRTFHLPD